MAAVGVKSCKPQMSVCLYCCISPTHFKPKSVIFSQNELACFLYREQNKQQVLTHTATTE